MTIGIQLILSIRRWREAPNQRSIPELDLKKIPTRVEFQGTVGRGSAEI